MSVLHVQDREWTVGTVADAYHRGMHQGMRIEIIFPCPLVIVLHLHEVRSVHRAPIPVFAIGEHRALIPPRGQVLHRSGPLPVILAAIAIKPGVVRTGHVDTELPGVVRILEHARFPVGHVFPEREVRVADEIGGFREGASAGNERQAHGRQNIKRFHIELVNVQWNGPGDTGRTPPGRHRKHAGDGRRP